MEDTRPIHKRALGDHANPEPDIDYNHVEGECGSIDPIIVEKQMNYIKVNHRSWDPIEFWTQYNFVETFDDSQAKDLIRLADLDVRHQYSLQQRAMRAKIFDKSNFEAAIADKSFGGVFPVHPKHSPEDVAAKCTYDEYRIAREQLMLEKRVKSGVASVEEQQLLKKIIEEGTQLGFSPWQPSPDARYYMSSIDRWHVDIIDKEFCTRVYESMNKPVMIIGLIEDGEKGHQNTMEQKMCEVQTPDDAKYPAHFWTIEYLEKSKFTECLFRLGDHDDGSVLRAKLKVFLQYLRTNKDDSPLYLFEDSVQRCPVSKEILSLYRVPPHFSHDLLLASMPSDHIPPYNWILVGPKRSGTRMHLDPRCTSAWNMSVIGRKRWVLFRPGVPVTIAKAHIVMTKEEEELRKDRGNPQAIYFFTRLLPRLRQWVRAREIKREQRLKQLAQARNDGDKKLEQKILREARIEQSEIENACEAAEDYVSNLEYFNSNADASTEALMWPEVTADPSFGTKVKEEKRGDGTWRRKKWNELEDGYGMMEFIQYPGETILVPSGWWHAVINVDNTIAYTQNFTNKENFVAVWRHMRRHNKSMARRWLYNLRRDRPDIAQIADELDAKDGFVLSPYAKHPECETQIDGAETSDEDLSASDSSDEEYEFDETDTEDEADQ